VKRTVLDTRLEKLIMHSINWRTEGKNKRRANTAPSSFLVLSRVKKWKKRKDRHREREREREKARERKREKERENHVVK